MDKLPDRPPFVRFEVRPVEDREATIEAGAVCYKDVNFALVTPAGSKDVHEAIAEEWLERLKGQAQSGRVPANWVTHFFSTYEAWKKNEEPPVDGTRLSHWPGLNKPQHDLLKQLKMQTIEDVAAMNEEAIARLGMGGRALKQRAQAFLDARNGPEKAAERYAALEHENEALRASLEKANADIAEIKALLPKQAKAGPVNTQVAM